jgi:hypothetical protein
MAPGSGTLQRTMGKLRVATGVGALLLLEGCRGGAARPTMPVPQDWGQLAAMAVFLLVLGLVIRRIFFS